jgi:arginine decarboxylase
MHSVNEYYSAIQLRSDRWSALRAAANGLVRETRKAKLEKLSKQVEDLFVSLALIEPYWAFPGMAAFDHLRRQMEHGNYDDLAFSINRVTRALTTGAYRRRHIPLDHDLHDSDEQDDEALQSPEARAMTKPYFEVLIVDSAATKTRSCTKPLWCPASRMR